MFGLTGSSGSEESPLPELSIIGSETIISADGIHGSGDLRIEGSIQTDIHQDGHVVIAPRAEVSGTVRARSIRVAGSVQGVVLASETLVLKESSVVRANIHAPSLTIEPGADLQGEVLHDSEVEATEASVDASPSSNESPPPFIDESAHQIFPLESEMEGVES